MTPEQVIEYHRSGQNMGAFRGHRKHPGASERQWNSLVKAAKAAKLDQDVDHIDVVLESLLVKGFSVEWILRRLDEKRDSRAQYRTTRKRSQRSAGDPNGWDPGRTRYFKRSYRADIELYWYQ